MPGHYCLSDINGASTAAAAIGRGVASAGQKWPRLGSLGMSVGSDRTRLIVVRGNSGSGKSSVANALREACGRGVAWVSQDLIRRTILGEKDRPGGVNIGLIDQVTRYILDRGYHVVLDGILYADRYEPLLSGLGRDHAGVSRFYYLDVSLEETLRRHLTRPLAAEVGAEQMRDWYRPRDLLVAISERIIPETSTLAQTTALILADTQLLAGESCQHQPAAGGQSSSAAGWRNTALDAASIPSRA
jgi:predicted kinase